MISGRYGRRKWGKTRKRHDLARTGGEGRFQNGMRGRLMALAGKVLLIIRKGSTSRASIYSKLRKVDSFGFHSRDAEG